MKSERQKALDGEFFNAVDPELQQIILRTKRLLRKLNDCDYADHESTGFLSSCLALSVSRFISMWIFIVSMVSISTWGTGLLSI